MYKRKLISNMTQRVLRQKEYDRLTEQGSPLSRASGRNLGPNQMSRQSLNKPTAGDRMNQLSERNSAFRN